MDKESTHRRKDEVNITKVTFTLDISEKMAKVLNKIFEYGSLDSIKRALETIAIELKEIKEIQMKTQADIDKLTADVKAGTAGVKDAILSEAAEIKAAIDSSRINTTELEAAVADSAKLRDAVSDIFTPETEDDGGDTDDKTEP